MTLCSSLQPAVYNFRLFGRLFLAPVMVFICLIRKGKYGWFLHAEPFLELIIFLLYLLQSVCCFKYSAKTSFSILNLFLAFLHPFALKHFRIFITVMWCKFHYLLKLSTRGTKRKEILLVLSHGLLLACFSMLETNSI